MSLIRICCAALGLPIWLSRSFLMELANLPAFVRPSRSEKASRLLNAPMRRFLRLAIEGRRWRAERCSAIVARYLAKNCRHDLRLSKKLIPPWLEVDGTA